MKRSVSYFFTVLSSALLLSSCKDCDTTVTPLEESDIAWLSYNNVDSLHYKDEQNKVVTFKKITSTAENVLGEGSQAGDDCIERMDTQAYILFGSDEGQHPVLGTYVLRRPNNLVVKVMASPNNSGFEINKEFPTYPTLEVGMHSYEDVFEFKQDSTNQLSIKQLLYNKNHGILRVEYYNGLSYEKI
jgi:hypothetical protein